MQFEKPTAQDAPKSGTEKPWTVTGKYKSGKTPEGFAATATPEQAKAGFLFYDLEQKQNYQPETVTAAIICVCAGVSGAVPSNPEKTKFNNYWSNLVKDTRYQKISVRMAGIDNPVASGLYSEFKPSLPDGVGYTKFALLYLFETKEVVLMELSASFEQSLKESIGSETGQKAERISLFNLFELQNRFWAFSFKGGFSKHTADGKPWSGKGEMYYYPEISTGIVTTDKYPELCEISEQMDAYIEAGQRNFGKVGTVSEQPSEAPKKPIEKAAATVQDSWYAPDPYFPPQEPAGMSESNDLPF